MEEYDLEERVRNPIFDAMRREDPPRLSDDVAPAAEGDLAAAGSLVAAVASPPRSLPPPATATEAALVGSPQKERAALIERAKVAETAAHAERERARAQAQEISTLQRQLEYSSAELATAREGEEKARRALDDARAAEQAQRAEARSDMERARKDSLALRAAQQTEDGVIDRSKGLRGCSASGFSHSTHLPACAAAIRSLPKAGSSARSPRSKTTASLRWKSLKA